MKIKIINWKEKSIKEIEVDQVWYEENGVGYELRFGDIAVKKCLPYDMFLGITE